MKPSVGRVVHYTAGDEHLAALVTGICSYPENGNCVDLVVFGSHGVSFYRGVSFDAGCRSATWHWPEKVE